MRKLNRSPLRITAEQDSPIVMRDGTILRADVYRPEGTVPTALVRSPYGEPNSHDGVDTIAWIAAQPWSNGDVVMSGTSYMA